MLIKSADTEAAVSGSRGGKVEAVSGKAEAAKYRECVSFTFFRLPPQSILHLYL
jgi:hypothetical protein